MKNIALSMLALILVLMAGFAAAQGDGGSQTPCELQYSTCKQTAHADYQFCKQASQQGCQERLDAALGRCRAARDACPD
ncbi:hypothetical protein QTI66_16070 [Variovorax sp. J22R133]|uniref:hypothetical protein n=1 Tax=Variovorax brevis TaxID=3053503 RepID=UPI002578E4E7|nr:hypothetical protein [Variovorax sp. J22R133]MDM0113676.1 hypothetical protein [Variovorax sp. J22R133]